MNSLHSSRKVVFLHLPKTAGTTFRNILDEVYGNSFKVCEDRTIQGIEATLARYDVVEFHAANTTTEWFRPFAEIVRLHRWDLVENAQVFTMLRDPVDRYISNYHYMVSHREFTEAALASHGFRFPESLEEMMSWPASYNFQIEFLLGKGDRDHIPSTQADLHEVKQMLLRVNAHVGLTEHFAQSVRIFEAITGRSVPANLIRRVNTTPNRPRLAAIPEEVRNLIRERSALEQDLYDFGRKLFLADAARYGQVQPRQVQPSQKAWQPQLAAAFAANPNGFTPALGAWSRLREAFTFRGTVVQ